MLVVAVVKYAVVKYVVVARTVVVAGDTDFVAAVVAQRLVAVADISAATVVGTAAPASAVLVVVAPAAAALAAVVVAAAEDAVAVVDDVVAAADVVAGIATAVQLAWTEPEPFDSHTTAIVSMATALPTDLELPIELVRFHKHDAKPPRPHLCLCNETPQRPYSLELTVVVGKWNSSA